jgi:hypothetical protein
MGIGKCCGQDWITRGVPTFPYIRGLGRNNSTYIVGPLSVKGNIS